MKNQDTILTKTQDDALIGTYTHYFTCHPLPLISKETQDQISRFIKEYDRKKEMEDIRYFRPYAELE